MKFNLKKTESELKILIHYFVFAILFSTLVACTGKPKAENSNDQVKLDSSKGNTNQKQEVFAYLSEKSNLEKKDYKVKILKDFAHDRLAFTQGLVYYKGFLYESTGLNGMSSLRKINPANMEVVKKISIPANYFAEGITIFNDKIYMLTYMSEEGFVFNLETFEQEKSFSYKGEGWGFTNDGTNLIMSNGSPTLTWLDPVSLKTVKTLEIIDKTTAPLYYINELEYINGEIWANIWQSDRIVRIDPVSGNVLGDIDGKTFRNALKSKLMIDVLNGIAYNYDSKTFYATGKNWPQIFEFELVK